MSREADLIRIQSSLLKQAPRIFEYNINAEIGCTNISMVSHIDRLQIQSQQTGLLYHISRIDGYLSSLVSCPNLTSRGNAAIGGNYTHTYLS